MEHLCIRDEGDVDALTEILIMQAIYAVHYIPHKTLAALIPNCCHVFFIH